jgi:DNA repair protein SbcC/Rad50
VLRQRTEAEMKLQKLRNELAAGTRASKTIKKVEADICALKMPTMTNAQISEIEHQWNDHHRWLQKKSLLEQGEHHCPKCAHHWPIASETLRMYDTVREVPAPEMTQAALMEERRLTVNIERQAMLGAELINLEVLRLKEEADLQEDMLEMVNLMESKQMEFDANAKNIRELEELLKNSPDQKEKIAARQKYDGAMLGHGARLMAYKQFFDLLAEREARIAVLEPSERALVALEEALVTSRSYEQAQAAHEAAVLVYAEAKQKLDGLLAQSEDWANAKAAIAEAKTVIKSFLIPSLNKVASLLINQMTGGARSSVIVDDDFNITVDGQQVQTLSGSGKAVANLALRIGLGQVLTNGVFSVFIADEFDESMDEERAQYTAECLQRLKQTIKQVIVVTHKRPIADHIFTLPLKEAA